MSPYKKIAQKYFDNPQEAPFGDYVEWFLRNGYVFSTPEYFVMGKNCRRLASATTITLPKVGLFTSLTGTTNVQTINGGWLSRRYRFIVPSGLSFVSGGNISTPITVGAVGVVDALYDGYTWSLH
jgi:hypothetical protein